MTTTTTAASPGPRARRRVIGVGLALTLALTACDGGIPTLTGGGNGSGDGADGTAAEEQQAPTAVTRTLEEDAVVDGDTSTRSVAVSAALFESSPVVVLTDAAEQARGAEAAEALGVPVLVDGPDVAAEVERLGAGTALTLGEVTDPGIDTLSPAPEEDVAAFVEAEPDLDTVPAEPVAGAAVLAQDSGESDSEDEGAIAEEDVAAVGTARAAGVPVIVGPTDPRGDGESVAALAEAAPEHVLALGEDFGEAEDLGWKVAAAATGVELPGGGQLVFPGKTYVALYGTPSTPSLGLLGDQPIEETVVRAEEMAADYEALTDTTVIPTLEVIVTVAAQEAGADGSYTNELPVSEIEPLVDLAAEHGQYVVLDLQPGRLDFLTQAQRYEDLLKRPNVGLALDPEWRLGPDQRPLQQIGQAEVAEINETIEWLADLTRENELPQKMVVLHMFMTHMIPDVDGVQQDREEVEVLIHADGQGAQGDKQATWRTLHGHAPSVERWGWKNFTKIDVPVLTPEQTMTQVDPVPDFISYQ